MRMRSVVSDEPHAPLTFCPLEMLQPHHLGPFPRRLDCGLVDKVLQVRTAHPGAPSRDDAGIDVDVVRHLAHVVFQNLDAASDVG
jgi:hypothetical protein